MTVTLKAQVRESLAKDAKQLRDDGFLPAVVYGPKQEAIPVALEKREFDRVFKEAGESTIISLEGLEHPVDVLVHEVEFAPTKGGIIHVDFYAIEKGKKITTVVPLEFIGESPAEKLGGVVNKVLHELEITCSPKDLPRHIEIDLSVLVEMDSRLTIAELKLPNGVTTEENPEDVVVIVSEAEEEPEEVPAELDMSAVEVEQKGKQDEEGEEDK